MFLNTDTFGSLLGAKLKSLVNMHQVNQIESYAQILNQINTPPPPKKEKSIS